MKLDFGTPSSTAVTLRRIAGPVVGNGAFDAIVEVSDTFRYGHTCAPSGSVRVSVCAFSTRLPPRAPVTSIDVSNAQNRYGQIETDASNEPREGHRLGFQVSDALEAF